MTSSHVVAFGSAPLRLADVVAVADQDVDLVLSASGRNAILRARDMVEALVENRVAAFGISTGAVSQKDFAVSWEAIARYNKLMITVHATMAPRPKAPLFVVRAALANPLALLAS